MALGAVTAGSGRMFSREPRMPPSSSYSSWVSTDPRAASHIARLRDNTAQSIETSSLHLDLISELKRINSHICSIAYPILESAGVLADTRLRDSRLAELMADDARR